MHVAIPSWRDLVKQGENIGKKWGEIASLKPWK
jgi:hypothetical protein